MSCALGFTCCVIFGIDGQPRISANQVVVETASQSADKPILFYEDGLLPSDDLVCEDELCHLMMMEGPKPQGLPRGNGNGTSCASTSSARIHQYSSWTTSTGCWLSSSSRTAVTVTETALVLLHHVRTVQIAACLQRQRSVDHVHRKTKRLRCSV